jgi:hypothetical protein
MTSYLISIVMSTHLTDYSTVFLSLSAFERHFRGHHVQGVQLKSGLYYNISNLFTKIYNMLYYTTNLYLQ